MPWAPTYVTTAELKSYLRIGDADDDLEIDFAIDAASRTVDQITNRQFGAVDAPEARVFTPRWDRRRGRYVIDIDDLATTTAMVVAFDLDDDETFETAVVLTDLRLHPLNYDEKLRPWTRIIVKDTAANQPTTCEGSVEITATWGWTAVPETVKQATLKQASRVFAGRNAPFGVAGSPEAGSELRILERVDADVAVMLRHYIRPWGAV